MILTDAFLKDVRYMTKTFDMKIGYYITYAALAVAFAAVSLWVILSRGKNAKAVRTKFRLGGLMLTIMGLMASSGCNRIVSCYEPVMCYDPVPPENTVNIWPGDNSEEVSTGDEIHIHIIYPTCESYSYRIVGSEPSLNKDMGPVIQEGPLMLDENGDATIVIEETDHSGDMWICILGKFPEAEETLLWHNKFVLK